MLASLLTGMPQQLLAPPTTTSTTKNTSKLLLASTCSRVGGLGFTTIVESSALLQGNDCELQLWFLFRNIELMDICKHF